jgi:uncharacterized protein YeaO (DUF488 family)
MTRCSHSCSESRARQSYRAFSRKLIDGSGPRGGPSIIKIKRVYEKPAKEDGWRVLVDRLRPQRVTKEAARLDAWMKDVAPSDTLRKRFGHKPEKWSEFQKKYRRELAKKRGLVEELKKMAKEHGTVTLLFGAKDEEHNEAVVLANALNAK